MLRFWSRLGEQWCRLAHNEVTWPVEGHYQCKKCLRTFPVKWEQETPEPARDFHAEVVLQNQPG